MSAAQYLDLAYLVWKSFEESLPIGWGFVFLPGTRPPPSGHIPKEFNVRGQTLVSLVEAMGTFGRANGVMTSIDETGVMILTVGPPAFSPFQSMPLAAGINVRESQSGTSGIRPLGSVTAEDGGQSSTVTQAGARFPSRKLITAEDGESTKFSAASVLESQSRSPQVIELKASVSLSAIRPGDVVLYIRRSQSSYIRVVSVTVDEDLLPTEFTITAQIVEPDALVPTRLTRGIYWPGSRGTGSAFIRRFQAS